MPATFTHKGDWKKTERFLKQLTDGRLYARLDQYGKMGVAALSEATPKDTGKTANSWEYEISIEPGKVGINWYNTNIVDEWANVALLIQYGHGTGTGGWVQGIDYINPALKDVFDKIGEDVWREVKGLK